MSPTVNNKAVNWSCQIEMGEKIADHAASAGEEMKKRFASMGCESTDKEPANATAPRSYHR